MKNCVITSAVRTAVGAYLGTLKTEPVEKLAAHVMAEAVLRSGLEKAELDEVIFGQALADAEASNMTRVAALRAGIPETVPAFTVNRQCASSIQAVVSAVQTIQCGHGEIVLAGGAENMSRSIFYMPPTSRFESFRMGDFRMTDSFSRGSECCQPADLYPNTNMGLTAENVAKKYGFTREELDAFAAESQTKAARAMAEGKFRDEIVPYGVATKKGEKIVFDTDEHPRPGTGVEKLAKLRPAFRKNGLVTAGNASGMNDGASAVVVMSGEEAEKRGIQPLVRIIDYVVTALDPRYMGLGPVNAVKEVLRRAGLEKEDIGLYELNEAFAAQSLGVLKELDMMPGTALYERVNVNGGAIALGHALGNSGTRILTTLIYEMKRRGVRYGIAALCIGGGQGMALLVENV